MRIGIIVLCRYNSRRLPGKVLKEIAGRSVLGHIMDRLQRGAGAYPIVVATSNEPDDDAVARFCRYSCIPCFRGSLENVSERFTACADFYRFDYAVRINADNIFTDPDVMKAMLAIAETDQFDFISNVPGRTFPYGMSVEIVRTSYFRSTLQYQNARHQEHVTSWLYEHEEYGRRFVYTNRVCPQAQGMQLALDSEEDFLRISKVITEMEAHPASYSLREVIKRMSGVERDEPWRGKCGALLIAEIGGNHEGNFDAAKALTQQAISAGADYVKFQLYRGDTLVSRHESPDRNTHFKRFELTREQHIELAEMCRKNGVGYMASVWDLEMLEWIDDYMPIYKIGSGDLTAWPLVKAFAKRGKPIILSTGLATLDEVMHTVAQIQSVDERYCDPAWLCLLQCTSMYPIAAEDANLNVMNRLKEATGLTIGYSDHTEGREALKVAAAMGAQVLEFHFTDTREGKVFRDHKVSLTAEELTALQHDLKSIERLCGRAIKIPQSVEIEQGHVLSFRRAAYSTRVIETGEKITIDDLEFLRPNHGVDVRDVDEIIGACVLEPIEPFRKIDIASMKK